MRLFYSILAAYQVLVGGAAFADYIGQKTAGLLVLVGAAVSVGYGEYVRSTVTPLSNPRDASGNPLVSDRR